MYPTVEIKGMQAIVKNAKRINKEAQERFKKATLATVYEINGDAKKLCKVDTNRCRASVSVNWTNSGLMYGEIDPTVHIGKSGKKPEQKPNDGIGNPGGGINNFLVAVGTNVEYSEHLENRYPYLWPAFNKNLRKLQQRIKNAMRTIK